MSISDDDWDELLEEEPRTSVPDARPPSRPAAEPPAVGRPAPAKPPAPPRPAAPPRSAERVPPPSPRAAARETEGAGGGGAAAPATAPLTPRPPEAGSAPERAASASAATRELILRCRAELALSPAPERAGRLYHELGWLHESALGDPQAAADYYQHAHKLLPSHLPTLQGLTRTRLALGALDDALAALEAQARLAPHASQRAALVLQRAWLLEDLGLRPEAAREAYQAAAALEPSQPAPQHALALLAAQAGAPHAFDRALEQEAAAIDADPSYRASLLLRRAELAALDAATLGRAVDLGQLALSVAPPTLAQRRTTQRLLAQAERWRELAEALLHEAASSASASRQVDALLRAAQLLQDRLGAPAEAVAALERAVELAPLDPRVTEQLIDAYENAQLIEPLIARLAARAELAPPSERAALWHRVAQLHEEHQLPSEQARAAFERALTADPAYLPALQGLGALLERVGDWEALIGMHAAEEAAVSDPVRRAAAHGRIAELAERRLADRARAITHHLRALALVGCYEPSFKALLRLHAEAGKHRELIELHERAVEHFEDHDRKLTHLFAIGRLQEDALGAPVSAMATYQRILALEPRHLGALHALQRAAERGARWAELIAALSREAALLEDLPSKTALLQRAGEIADERLGDRELALSRWRECVALDAGYAPALSSLGRTYYRLGHWQGLIEIYELELAREPRGERAASLWVRIGQLHESFTGDLDAADRAYDSALTADPLHRAALRARARRLLAVGAHARLAQLLSTEASATSAPRDKARLLQRMAEIQEHRLGAPEKALAGYEQAAQLDPELLAAVDARHALLAARGEHRRLVDELARDARAASSPERAVACWCWAGTLWRDQLGDPHRASECFAAAVGVEPSNLQALLALESLQLGLADWAALAKTLTALARHLRSPLARVDALRRLARVQSTKLPSDPVELKRTYTEILALLPEDELALRGLEQLALAERDTALLTRVDAKLGAISHDPAVAARHFTRLGEALAATNPSAALEVLESAIARDPENLSAARAISRLALDADSPELLVSAAEGEVRASRDLDFAATLFLAAARAFEAAGAPARAADALQRALELHPEHEGVAQRLEALLLASGEHERLRDVLSAAAQAAKTPSAAARAWLAVARLWADPTGDVPAALAALYRVLELDVPHVDSLLLMARLYVRDGQWAQAVDKLGQALAQQPRLDQELEARLSSAELLAGKLGDPERALQQLQELLSVAPEHVGALARQLELEQRLGRQDDAVTTARRLAAATRDPVQQAAAQTQLGLLLQAQGAREAALEAFEHGVALVGFGEPAHRLRSLLEGSGEPREWQRYADALARRLAQPGLGLDAVAAALLELGRIQGGPLGQPEQAVRTLRHGLSLARDDWGLNRELVTQLLLRGHFAEALPAQRRLLELNVTQSDVWRELSSTFRALGRLEEATLALAPLVVLGAATDAEQAALLQRGGGVSKVRANSFDAQALAHLSGLPQRDPILAWLEALGDVLPKLYPAELERYGLGPRDRLHPRSGHPLQRLAERVAGCFGVSSFDVYLHQSPGAAIEIELADPIAVMVPAGVPGLPESQQVFLLARVFANLSRHAAVVDKLPARTIEILVTAARVSAGLFLPPGAPDAALITETGQQLQKLGSRRSRRLLEEAAALPFPSVDYAQWAAQLRTNAALAALVIADELPANLTLLRRLEGDLAGLKGAAREQALQMLQQLLGGWLTEAAMDQRRRAGLSGFG